MAMESVLLRELLADIQTTFVVEGTDRLWSAQIAKAIHAIAGRPWAKWGRTGRPISPNQIARLLKQCSIYPEKIRIGNRSRRGYYLSQFTEAFERYCSVLEQRNNGEEIWTSEPFQTGTEKLTPSAATPPHQRVITVKRPGIAPEGPDEISHERWLELGCSVERLKAYLRQRGTETANAPQT
jgi:hypothetical protein